MISDDHGEDNQSALTPEHARLSAEAHREANWKRWGPYLSERQWGTVREDYSADGNAWRYFPFEHARSRACAGVRTASWASATGRRGCASRSRCGTGTIRF